MSNASSLVGSPAGRAINTFFLRVIFVLAILVGLFTVIGNTVEISTTLPKGHVPLTLMIDKALPAAATNCHGCTLTGTFATANVDVTGLSGQAVGFSLAAAIANALTELALCALIAILAWRLLRRGFFRRALSNAVAAAGTVLAGGSIVSQACIALGTSQAALDINGPGKGYWPLEASFDPTIPVFGIVLILVGLAFEYGTRLQKDTEGLV
jgi:hypothetical protein